MSSSLQDLAIIYEMFPKLEPCHSLAALTLDLTAESPNQYQMMWDLRQMKWNKQGFLQLLLVPHDC